jgi:hypothetical protein
LAVGIVAALEALSFRLVLKTTKKTKGEFGFKLVFYENYYYNRCYSSLIGRATPTTGNQSIEDSNITGEAWWPPSGIN